MVSIVLATYNGQKYLLEQLNSIAKQTYQNIEIIICDDASEDSTVNIIKEFAEAKHNVSYHINEKNIGVNKNFENGFLKAKGDFIAIADQDDIWLPEKIATQMALFTSEDIVLTHSNSVRFTGNTLPTKKLKNITIPFEGNNVKKLLLRNSVSGHNIIFRKKLLQQILPIPANVYFDWWIVQTAACNAIVKSTNKVLAFQRVHQSNVTVQKRTTVNQSVEEYNERKLALYSFLTLKGLKEHDRLFIEDTLKHFLLLEDVHFSKQLFNFLLKHRTTFFYYKKGIFKYFSQKKAAWRMSFKE